MKKKINKFWSPVTRVATPIFDQTYSKHLLNFKFNLHTPTQLSIFMNLYQYTKNLTASSICSRDFVDLKIPQSDCPGAFWPMSKEPDFSQIWALCSNTANNINFFFRPNSEKINDQIFQYNQKRFFFVYFCVQFSWFSGQKAFFQNIWLSGTS